jgi:hypothetical protein
VNSVTSTVSGKPDTFHSRNIKGPADENLSGPSFFRILFGVYQILTNNILDNAVNLNIIQAKQELTA